MAHEQSSQQDRGLFGLFGGKKDEHQQQHGTTGYNAATDQGYGGHVSSGTGHGTGGVDQGTGYNVPASGYGSHATGTGYNTGTGTGHGGIQGTDTGYGTGVGHVGPTPDTGYNATGTEYTTGAPLTAHPGGEEKKHGLLGKLHRSGSSSSSSSDEETVEGKERRKKGGIKEKIKNILPGHKKEEDRTAGVGHPTGY